MADLLNDGAKALSERWYPQPQSPRWRQMVFRFIRAGLGFWHDDCIDRASLLAYTTLLAIVPLLAVIFSLWNIIGFAEDKRRLIDRYVFQSFLPQVGDTVIHWLNLLASRGASLGWYGVIGLLFTALLLIHEIERHFNAIWGEKVLVHWLRPLRYIFLLILGPIASAVLILSLGPVQHWLARVGVWPVFPEQLNDLIAFVVEVVIFWVLYRVLPAAHVDMADALLGALTAALLLSLAKFLLTLYIRYSITESLYGALGLLPVFLLWLYLTWLAVLFGAETAAAAHYRKHQVEPPVQDAG
ncbi:YihY/virulence factor BrkB family protein [Acidithiobacillus sp. IBUN Pt1247-S3]|uniref:YihY/virulence factor BrkB family protein n=1 Tax=Acidithiobacillus sp. IBUN Pt1247-S3 TaxID=3166642 RepID=UPI0034E5D65B